MSYALNILFLWAMVSIRRFFRLSTPLPTRLLPLTLNRFSSGFACCFTRNNLSTFLCSNQIIAKKNTMHFQCKTIFSFQHIAGRFWFCCFLYICFLGCFSQFCHHKTTNSFIFAKYMYSVIFGPHQIMWRNKRNFGHILEIISCCFF